MGEPSHDKPGQTKGNDRPAKPATDTSGTADAAAKARAQRQAEELRRNLLRRKAQQRDRRDQSS
jgi:hypothetical protein